MPQGLIDRLTETGSSCRMKINVKRPQVMRISRKPFLLQIMRDKRQLKFLEYFNYVGSMITNGADLYT